MIEGPESAARRDAPRGDLIAAAVTDGSSSRVDVRSRVRDLLVTARMMVRAGAAIWVADRGGDAWRHGVARDAGALGGRCLPALGGALQRLVRVVSLSVAVPLRARVAVMVR